MCYDEASAALLLSTPYSGGVLCHHILSRKLTEVTLAGSITRSSNSKLSNAMDAIKIEDIRGKDWAEPTGAVLKAAAKVASLLPPPAGGVIKGALNLGGALLNPDPTLADLRRAKEDIQEEVRGSFKEVAQEMSEIRDEFSDVRDNVEVLMEIVTEQEFKRGIEEVESNHEYFLKGVENLEKTIEEFKPQAVSFQTAFKTNFKIKKLFNYLKIVKSREGNEACEQFYQELLSPRA